MILDTFPSAEEFYKTYWNKKPFLVKNAIDASLFDDMIDGDYLAGLALEEDIKSRIVSTSEDGNAWACEHGPFDDDHFSTLGENNWALLVQNVEQYHKDTAKLLQNFNISPRWLMDDIMVSYSTPHGSVGPHTDSYHVFLTQGIGKRQWKVSHAPIIDPDHIEGQDLKVLKHSFDGDTVEVTIGDVLYIPPHFAHEGKTIDTAMTFSIGFLGPTLSEMLTEFGLHIEQAKVLNKRYSGQNIDPTSAAFLIADTAQKTIQSDLISAIQSDEFPIWMAEYFSKPTHDDAENIEAPEEQLTEGQIQKALEDGVFLHKYDHIKLALTTSADAHVYIAVYGKVIISIPSDNSVAIDWLNHGNAMSLETINMAQDKSIFLSAVTALYNHGALYFDDGLIDE